MCIYTYILYLHIQIKLISCDDLKHSFKMLYMDVYTCMHAKSLESCPTLCDCMNCSPPGSSVHGILQARTVEWVAMPSSRGSSPPRDRSRI